MKNFLVLYGTTYLHGHDSRNYSFLSIKSDVFPDLKGMTDIVCLEEKPFTKITIKHHLPKRNLKSFLLKRFKKCHLPSHKVNKRWV